MSQTSRTPDSTSASDAGYPRPEIRTVVSFLVFLHLFMLAVSVVGARSDLAFTVANLPGIQQYRQGLWMDLNYTYYLTRGNDVGGELDVDYATVATVKMPDGETETLEFPPPGTWPHQRAHRYQVLAQRVAEFAADETSDAQDRLTLLAQAVATGVLKQTGGQSVNLLFQGRLTAPAMNEFNPDNATNWTRFRTAYEGRAFVAGNTIEMLKKEPARDTAPPPKDE